MSWFFVLKINVFRLKYTCMTFLMNVTLPTSFKISIFYSQQGSHEEHYCKVCMSERGSIIIYRMESKESGTERKILYQFIRFVKCKNTPKFNCFCLMLFLFKVIMVILKKITNFNTRKMITLNYNKIFMQSLIKFLTRVFFNTRDYYHCLCCPSVFSTTDLTMKILSVQLNILIYDYKLNMSIVIW